MSINLETHTLELEKTQVGNDSGGKVDTQKQQHRQVTDSNKVGEIVEVMISGGNVEVEKRGEMRGSWK